MTKHINVVNPLTGEQLEFNASTPEEILEAWQIASSYIKAYEQVKDRLKKVIDPFLNERGLLELDGYLFRKSFVQPMTYDKAVLRQVFDEDELDLFLKPDKTNIDKYLKEHLNELGEASSMLRQTMIPAGKSYTVVRVEKTI